MKRKRLLMDLSIVAVALFAIGQPLWSQTATQKPAMPTGKFQADMWVDFTTLVNFGKPTTEKREDGTYSISPAGVIDSYIIMKFADGSTLRAEIMNRWAAGGASVWKPIDPDPTTGQSSHWVGREEGTYDMYTEAGQILFTGAYHVLERHFYYNKDGAVVKIEEVKPVTGEGAGIGPYEGHVIVFGEGYASFQTRDGKPYVYISWKSGEIK